MKIKGFIRSVELSLNNHCSLQCVGCSSLNPESPKSIDMDFSSVLNVLKDIDIQEFVLCGNNGEPLEHRDIANVLLKLTESFPKARIHVSTNGEKIQEKLSSVLPGLRNVHFQIAVDGHKSSVHELTRRKGNLDLVFENIQFLLFNQADLSLIYSRHRLNEEEAQKTHQLVMEKFGLPLHFRDTTQVTDVIRPPLKLSQNGNVSVLYAPITSNRDFTPNMKHIYIECTGESYPCVSFCKHKTDLRPVNITEYQDAVQFLKDFVKFQSAFCTRYQETGDLRQCNLNCGIYRNFRYDTIEDLKAL